jgi:hypothetical protein
MVGLGQLAELAVSRAQAAGKPPAIVWLARLAWRFFSGRHLDGRARSDATFWRTGSEPLGEQYWASRGSWWAMRAGKHRLMVRVVAAAIGVGLWRWRQGTEWALALTGGPLLGLASWRACRAVVLWRHRRQLERPMSAALSPYLGVSPMAVESGLRVRPDYMDADGGEHLAALSLPDHWAATPDQRKLVEQVMEARFGVGLKFQWRTASYPMVLNVTRAPVPPGLVRLADWLDRIATLPLERIMLGLDAERSPRDWDTSREDPHIAIHGGSRRGKTSVLLLITVQIIRKWALAVLRPGSPACTAGRVCYIDPKRVSSASLAGVPGVELHNDPRDVDGMWAGVAAFRELVEDRYDALAADPTLEFQPALLVIDEVSQFAGMSAMHWRATKAKSDPALPPVWNDVATAVWMGAQARAHVVVAGQRLDYAILGGMLGSFGVRLLAGYTPQDYARLVGQPPFLRSQKPRGRFLLYEGGECTWLQLVKVDDPDGDYTALRDWALGGPRGPDLDAMPGTGTRDAREVVGLAAAAELLGMELEAFKKARQRRPVPGETAGPDGRTPAWPADALTRWRAERPSANRSGS